MKQMKTFQPPDKTEPYEIVDAAARESITNLVPNTTTINGKALSSDITLTASDVGALPDTTTIPSIDGLAATTYVDEKVADKADSSHTHTKSEITDFPTSLPASDVSAWAKASTKPTYTADEVGAATMTEVNAAIEAAIAAIPVYDGSVS